MPRPRLSARRAPWSVGAARRAPWLAVGASIAAEVVTLARCGYGLGGTVVVRCRDGHLFSTLWVPGASLTSLRLGPWRLQRCPVGRHWTLVTPVRREALTDPERAAAAAAHDVRLP